MTENSRKHLYFVENERNIKQKMTVLLQLLFPDNINKRQQENNNIGNKFNFLMDG